MRVNAFSFILVHNFYSVWVICVRDVCEILLIIYEFRKRRSREDRVFPMGVQKITFIHVICSCMTFREPMYHARHGVHHLHSWQHPRTN